MKFVVAIDWTTKDGYTFLELEAKNEVQAMIEAPAVVYAYSGMEDVWCLRILKQTSSDVKKLMATLTPHIFYPTSYRWNTSECGGDVWYNVETISFKPF